MSTNSKHVPLTLALAIGAAERSFARGMFSRVSANLVSESLPPILIIESSTSNSFHNFLPVLKKRGLPRTVDDATEGGLSLAFPPVHFLSRAYFWSPLEAEEGASTVVSWCFRRWAARRAAWAGASSGPAGFVAHDSRAALYKAA